MWADGYAGGEETGHEGTDVGFHEGEVDEHGGGVEGGDGVAGFGGVGHFGDEQGSWEGGGRGLPMIKGVIARLWGWVKKDAVLKVSLRCSGNGWEAESECKYAGRIVWEGCH